MKVLFTGAASPLGMRVLSCVLEDEKYAEVWCGVHDRAVSISHPKLRQFKLRLEGPINLSEIAAPLNQVVHFAAATHARNQQDYWDVNLRGTINLVTAARALGCRRFVYASTRCATDASGEYGKSKLAAEVELQRLDWDSLLIVRPAEIYGALGSEGIDSFIGSAARFHVVPLLWGDKGIRFAPVHVDEFVITMCALLKEQRRGVHVLDICGPESLSGSALAWRIARRYAALPLPLWWPACRWMLRLLHALSINPVPPDQIARLLGPKTAERSTADPTLIRPKKLFLRD